VTPIEVLALAAAFTLFGLSMFVYGLHTGLRVFGISLFALWVRKKRRRDAPQASKRFDPPGEERFDEPVPLDEIVDEFMRTRKVEMNGHA